ncbi:siderophore-interacting protein [Nonomuraea typhae]|uniref:siderophore-interacting protein n=1 Tax=Nonomuraea typhae TaxID=2603600 RepID=UPI001C66F9AA|nr:siderophore-interacting protein [Nonomuraea typhae]
MNIGKLVIDRLLVTATVAKIGMSTRRMRLIRLEGPALAGLSWTPGQHVRILVGDIREVWRRPGDMLRTYSIWDLDSTGLELLVLDHGEGPGAQWARAAQPGDEVSFKGPEGTFVTRAAPYHVFAGDETASVTFGAMLRHLSEPFHGVVEVDTSEDVLPLPDGITWTFREGRSAASSSELAGAVAALDLPSEPGLAYLAGEARTIQLVRAHLVNERGWPRRNVITKPYWTPGKTGLD